jgi:WD40 repeat protein
MIYLTKRNNTKKYGLELDGSETILTLAITTIIHMLFLEAKILLLDCVLKHKNQKALFEGHSDTVLSIATTNDSKYPISESDDSGLRVWNMHKVLKKFYYKAILVISVFYQLQR